MAYIMKIPYDNNAPAVHDEVNIRDDKKVLGSRFNSSLHSIFFDDH